MCDHSSQPSDVLMPKGCPHLSPFFEYFDAGGGVISLNEGLQTDLYPTHVRGRWNGLEILMTRMFDQGLNGEHAAFGSWADVLNPVSSQVPNPHHRELSFISTGHDLTSD